MNDPNRPGRPAPARRNPDERALLTIGTGGGSADRGLRGVDEPLDHGWHGPNSERRHEPALLFPAPTALNQRSRVLARRVTKRAKQLVPAEEPDIVAAI